MTKIEKGLSGLLIVLFILFFVGMCSTLKQINEAGGIKKVIVEAGKEIKDIKKQIEEK